MAFFGTVKNAMKLICSGEWREFLFRLRIYLGQIDLEFSSQADLNLPADRCYDYADSGGLQLERVLKDLQITAEDAILDFGSGKGGALFTFSKYPFAKIAGCEISAELVEIARKNLAIMGVRKIEFLVRDAAELQELDDYTFFYFFNPFPCTVMRGVVSNLVASLLRRPRKVTIIYVNPECHDIMVTGTPFTKQREYEQNVLKYYIYTNDARKSGVH